MSAPHLQHLAQLIANEGHAATFQSLGQYRTALLKEIAQASAAPEQEAALTPAAYRTIDEFGSCTLSIGKIHQDSRALVLADHAERLIRFGRYEIERLREERESFQRVGIKAMEQLAEAQALVRKFLDGKTPVRELVGECETFLSATAQPAEPHDAETDDGSCPECEGACSDHCGPCRQCGGQGTFEAALRHAQPAEGQTNE